MFLNKNSDVSTCPVCRSPISAMSLAGEIDKRIDAMNALGTALRNVENAKLELKSVESQRDVEVEKVGCAIDLTIRTICGASLTAFGLSEAEKEAWLEVSAESAEEVRIANFSRTIEKFTMSLVAIIKAGEDAQKTLNQRNAILGHVRQIARSAKQVESLAARKALLAEILGVVETERKAFVSDVLIAISSSVEDLYNRIHPNESVGGIKLSLDAEFIGSLHLHANFHSATEITPQSVFSESHLDTLGLCVFLALAKHYSINGIIVLDDVLTSVDATHLDRIITLFHEEAAHFSHTLITTHYRPWRDRYRFHRAPAAEVSFIELRTWNLDAGIRLVRSQSSLGDLKAVLDAVIFDRQGAASKAGQLLENLLDFLARTYHCRLPLTGQHHYTLGELLDCFSKELRKVLRVERLDKSETVPSALPTAWIATPLPPVFDRLKGLALVRNQVGAHYNTLGSDCTDSEVENFAKSVVELAELLICPFGGDLPDRNKTGSFFHSKSGHVRLYPLEEPD